MPATSPAPDLKSLVRSLKDEAEMEAIRATLEQTHWNRKEAARRLNVSYKALLYKIRQYGIEQDHSSAVSAA
jgi:DNA-binding NtrC family response regulator